MTKIKLELELDDSVIALFEEKRKEGGSLPLKQGDWAKMATSLFKNLSYIADVVDAATNLVDAATSSRNVRDNALGMLNEKVKLFHEQDISCLD